MTPIDIQVSRSKVSVEGQTFSLYVGEGGISVLQTAIFSFWIFRSLPVPNRSTEPLQMKLSMPIHLKS